MRQCRHRVLTAALCGFAFGASAVPAGAQGAASAKQVRPPAAPADPIDYSTARLDKIVHALRITEPITMDGRLDEPAWEHAEPATHFTQWEPEPGMPASEETEVRFLYDDENLYVGARAFDSDPAHLMINELRKDFGANETDLIGIVLDTLHDRQTGFFFATNPAGARRDLQVARDGDQINQDWDGVWDVRTTVDEQGWIAEFVIPFKTLRFTNARRQEWGLNVLRRIRRRNEDTDWAPIPRRYRINRVSLAGTLTGLEGIRQGRNLKIKPFVTGGVIDVGRSGSRRTERDGGIDVKYGLTPSMTLDLTYRTDFSQVEADQQQVNLTRFNLFFPEKRDFFLENSGLFSVSSGGTQNAAGGSGPANLIPFFSRRIGLSSSGTPIPIGGGARVTGKVGAYDVGVLTMRTGEQDDLSSNTFLVGRVRKNFPGNSTVGAMVTSRDSADAGDYNRVYGVDAFLRFFEKLEISSYLLRSETPGRRGRDLSRLFGATWRDNDVTVSGLYEDVQPNFNTELGFIRRRDMSHYSSDLSWRPRPRNTRVIRNFNLALGADQYADVDGRVESREQNAGTGIAFQNGATLNVSAVHTFDRLVTPFAIQSTVTVPAGDYRYTRYAVNYNSDRSRAIGGSLSASVGEFWDGDSRTFGGQLDLKPNYHLSLDVNVTRNDVTLPWGNFVTNLVGLRLLYSFTPKAFFNTFLQYNATTNELSSNTRFNVMHRPLSDLYLVYNDRRDTSRHALVERALIVKFTNMFDF